MRAGLAFISVTLGVILATAACGESSTGSADRLGQEGENCTKAADCADSLRCIDSKCTRSTVDGDADPDASESDTLSGDSDPEAQENEVADGDGELAENDNPAADGDPEPADNDNPASDGDLEPADNDNPAADSEMEQVEASDGDDEGEAADADETAPFPCDSKSCNIGGTCIAEGVLSKTNSCLVCDPLSNRSDWSTRGYGASCDDGTLCTYEDTCDGLDGCLGKTVKCAASEGVCGPSYVCNGSSACSTTYSTVSTPCDDGVACTYSDHCDGKGGCQGEDVSCPPDNGGTCGAHYRCNGSAQCDAVLPGSSVTCNDNNDFSVDDRCDGQGKCVGTLGGNGDPCLANTDCRTGFSCNTQTMLCRVPECTTLTTCATSLGNGYVCENGFCRKQPCTRQDDCPTSFICDGGECQAGPACTAAAEIRIVRAPGVIVQNGTHQLRAIVLTADYKLIPLTNEQILWTSDATNRVGVSSTGLITGQPIGGMATITAKVACKPSVTATLAVTNILPSRGSTSVIVLDEEDGTPLPGVRVTLVAATAGNSDLWIAPLVTTDENGLVLIPLRSTGGCTSSSACDLHVFGDGYGYASFLSVVGTEFLVPLKRDRALNLADGVRGHQDGAAIPTAYRGDTFAAFTSFASRQSLAAFSPGFKNEASELVKTRVKLSSIDNEFNIISNAEGYLKGNGAVKDGYFATGEAGPALLWGWGGHSHLSTTIDLISAIFGGDTIDAQSFFTLNDINSPNLFHGLQAGYQLSHHAKIIDSNDRNGNGSVVDYVADIESFPTANLKLTQHLSRQTTVSYPDLPLGHANQCVGGAATVLGVQSPLWGFVPLGTSGAADKANKKDTPNCKVGTANNGQIALSYAPRYGVLSGEKYTLLSFAGHALYLATLLAPGSTNFLLSDISNGITGNDTSQVLSYSMIVTRSDEIPGTVALPSFLGLPTAANASATESAVTLHPQADPNATISRFVFSKNIAGGSRSTTWTIYAYGRIANSTIITLPQTLYNPAYDFDRGEFQLLAVKNAANLNGALYHDDSNLFFINDTLSASAKYVFPKSGSR